MQEDAQTPCPINTEARELATNPLENRIPQEEINRKIQQYDKSFSMPGHAQEKAERSEAFIVPESRLEKEIKDHITKFAEKAGIEIPQQDTAVLTQEEQQLRDAIFKMFGKTASEAEESATIFDKFSKAEAELIGGVCIPVDKTKSRIFIKENAKLNKDVILGHEVLHAAGGFQSEDGRKHYLNEAATEILRIASDHSDLSSRSLLNKIRRGEIQTPFASIVLKLLAILEATSLNAKPVDVKKLAEYYFSDDPVNDIMFEMEAVRKAHKPLREKVKSMLDTDLS